MSHKTNSLFLLVLMACGGGANPDRILQATESVSHEELFPVKSARHYRLKFTLAPAGQVVLISHAGIDLKNGNEISFQRVGARLQVKISADGLSEDISSFFASYDATGALAFTLDIHNDHGAYAHWIIWDAQTQRTIIDSSSDFDSPGAGKGTAAGLHMFEASIHEFYSTKAQRAH